MPMVKAMPVPSGLMKPVLSSHSTLVKSTLSYLVRGRGQGQAWGQG